MRENYEQLGITLARRIDTELRLLETTLRLGGIDAMDFVITTRIEDYAELFDGHPRMSHNNLFHFVRREVMARVLRGTEPGQMSGEILVALDREQRRLGSHGSYE
jgi:hypothetical protein